MYGGKPRARMRTIWSESERPRMNSTPPSYGSRYLNYLEHDVAHDLALGGITNGG